MLACPNKNLQLFYLNDFNCFDIEISGLGGRLL